MQLKSQVTKKLKNRFLVFVFSSLKKKNSLKLMMGRIPVIETRLCCTSGVHIQTSHRLPCARLKVIFISHKKVPFFHNQELK